MNESIWKWKNTAHITKMGIEGTFALASLVAGITMTEITNEPAPLEFIVSPIGIASLFVAAIYFVALACCSYQQMHATKCEKCEQGPQVEMGEVLNLASKLQKPEIMQIFTNKFQEKTA